MLHFVLLSARSNVTTHQLLCLLLRLLIAFCLIVFRARVCCTILFYCVLFNRLHFVLLCFFVVAFFFIVVFIIVALFFIVAFIDCILFDCV